MRNITYYKLTMNRDKNGKVQSYKITKRFLRNNIKIVNECWEWQGTINKDGYAVIGYNYKQVKLHRIAYELWNKPIPKDLCACHKCDNPKCINPKHIFIGSIKENNKDMFFKGRGRKIQKGEYTGEKNPRSKLNWEIVKLIRSGIYSQKSQQEIAKMFNVSQMLISKILLKQIWKEDY